MLIANIVVRLIAIALLYFLLIGPLEIFYNYWTAQVLAAFRSVL